MKIHAQQIYGPGIHEYELVPNLDGDAFNYTVKVYCVKPFDTPRRRHLIRTNYTETLFGAKWAAKRAVKLHVRRTKKAGFDQCHEAVIS